MKQDVSPGNNAVNFFKEELSPGDIPVHLILECLPAAVIICDLSGAIKMYNQAALQLFGQACLTGDPSGRAFFDRFYDLGGKAFSLADAPLEKDTGNGKPGIMLELMVEQPDHSRKFVNLKTLPLQDKKERLFGRIFCFNDITLQKIQESGLQEREEEVKRFGKQTVNSATDGKEQTEALQKSEERYHKMVEEVEDYAIILLDKNGIIQNWNKGAEKIKGYKESEIVGKSFEEFYLPQDREKRLPFTLRELAAKEGKAIHEGWRLRKDGTVFWGSIVLTALHDEHKNIIGFSKVTRDLTERKIAEDKLHEYTRQLKFQNEQLEQFAYAASHDMKEPLRKIQFYNNHLWETVGSSLGEKEKEYLSRSLKAAKRMQKLIDDLLEYSKASIERHDFEKVDLNEIVDELILSYKETIEEKKAKIKVSFLPMIEGIPFQLRQLFDNLLSNALKYSSPQRQPEIRVTVGKCSGTLFPELNSSKEYCKISFCDNGIGFEKGYEDKIFELFQRLGTTRYSGTGVGLALCKKIVQNHFGAIFARGRENEGACFDIYLPV